MSSFENSIDALMAELRAYRAPGVCNFFAERHAQLDRPNAAEIRTANLRTYLRQFGRAKLALIGEAAGYNGARFSGIAFTCETQLTGPGQLGWARQGYATSSAGELRTERSGTCVWQTIGDRTDVVLWNAFPWHPMAARGPLSNGKPGPKLRDALPALDKFLALVRPPKIAAVGRVAEQALTKLGIAHTYVRHPAYGGNAAFAAGVHALLGELS